MDDGSPGHRACGHRGGANDGETGAQSSLPHRRGLGARPHPRAAAAQPYGGIAVATWTAADVRRRRTAIRAGARVDDGAVPLPGAGFILEAWGVLCS